MNTSDVTSAWHALTVTSTLHERVAGIRGNATLVFLVPWHHDVTFVAPRLAPAESKDNDKSDNDDDYSDKQNHVFSAFHEISHALNNQVYTGFTALTNLFYQQPTASISYSQYRAPVLSDHAIEWSFNAGLTTLMYSTPATNRFLTVSQDRQPARHDLICRSIFELPASKDHVLNNHIA